MYLVCAMEVTELKKQSWKGSYTVEAAIIFSVTFFVLGSLIMGAFYVHDRAVLQGAACESAAAGANSATDKERNIVMKKVKKQISSQRLLGSRKVSGSTGAGSKKISASWSALFPVPGFAAKYLMGNQLNISVSWECTLLDPADSIRRIRGAEKLLNGGSR